MASRTTNGPDGISYPKSGVGGQMARGAVWMASTRFLARLLGFANTLILARLLTPSDFGVVALGVILMQLLQAFSDIGVAQTVIRYTDSGKREYDTLFTFSLIRGGGIAAILIGLSFFVEPIYGDPRVGVIFLTLAGTAMIQSLMNPKFYEFERALDFSREFYVSTAARIIGVGASISCAIIFRTYWAIVMSIAVGAVVQVVLSYACRPYLPRLTLSAARQLLSFTGWLTATSAMFALNTKFVPLILGRILGVGPTGTFYVAHHIGGMPTTELAYPVSRALYPGLSALSDRPKQLRETYLQGVEALSIIAMPAAFGCAFVAPDLIQLLLGERWVHATPILQVLAPMMALMAIVTPTHELALACGQPRAAFMRELIFFLIKAPLIVWVATHHGLVGTAFAVGASALIYTALQCRLYKTLTGRVAVEPLLRVRRPLGALAAMSIYFISIRPELGLIDQMPLALRLGVDILSGMLIFLGTLALIWRAGGQPKGIERILLRHSGLAPGVSA